MEIRSRARILMADDHTLIAEACKRLLEPEFEVVGIVADGCAAVQAATRLRPDVIVLDISMPLLNGLDAGEQIRKENRAIKLVYLTMKLAPDVAAETFRRGGSAYVPKHCCADELIIAIRCVLRSKFYLSPMITRDTVEYLLRSGAVYEEKKHISRRQSEVLQLLAEGKSMKEIACMLKVQTGTVAFYKYTMMDTLGIKSSAGLLKYGIKHHIDMQ
jgi:DNA-binding NarL/FixJ family response regulator